MKLVLQIAAGILLAGAVATFGIWAAQATYSSVHRSRLEDKRAAAFRDVSAIKSVDEIKSRCGKPFAEQQQAAGKTEGGVVLSYIGADFKSVDVLFLPAGLSGSTGLLSVTPASGAPVYDALEKIRLLPCLKGPK